MLNLKLCLQKLLPAGLVIFQKVQLQEKFVKQMSKRLKF